MERKRRAQRGDLAKVLETAFRQGKILIFYCTFLENTEKRWTVLLKVETVNAKKHQPRNV